MKRICILLLSALVLIPVSCSHLDMDGSGTESPATPAVETRTYSFKVSTGDITKVAYNGNTSFSYSSDDYLELLMSNALDKRASVLLPMVSDGVFSAENISLGTYTSGDEQLPWEPADIKGAVISKAGGSGCNAFYNGSGRYKLKLVFPVEQTQSVSGDADWTSRARFWAHIPSSKISANGSEVTISDLSLQLTGCVWEYHVFGLGTGEKLKSVTVSVESAHQGSTNFIVGDAHRWSDTGGQASYGNGAYSTTVTLDTAAPIGSTLNDAAIVYHVLYPQGNNDVYLGTITVVTDAATYKHNFGGRRVPRGGNVYPINIDLSYFANVYSTDGGNSWCPSLPSGSGFTRLQLREGAVLTSSMLSDIRTWINGQSGVVDLDLSGCLYESGATFPVVFGNATAASACAKLGSIKFPSNVTGFTKRAFQNCTGLADVDFSNITSISDEGTDCYTFSGCTALTEINLPKLTTMGRYTFYGCSNLTKITFGPSVTKFGGRSMESCPKLADIYIYATTPPSQNGNTYFLKNSGTSVAAEARKIHVPAGCVDTYNNFSCKFNSTTLTPWKESITGYTLVELD